MGPFEKTVYSFLPFTIFAKSSIFVVWLGSDYVFDIFKKMKIMGSGSHQPSRQLHV